jgi:tRNA(Ile)-lysidine synthase
MILLASLRDFYREHGLEKTYWVAYSGGLDSHVLLSLSAALRGELNLRLRVIHINHGLSPNANHWSLHCASVCKDFDIDYLEQTIAVNKGQDSLEEAARYARYANFASHLGENEILLTAHHQDDQAETVFIQLLRGAGLKGLSAMPVLKKFARGFHARPLLHFPRSVLEDYAKEKKLNWIEDESNQEIKFTRNFIRHEILTPLKVRWKTVTQTVARSALHCSEAEELLSEFAHLACAAAQGSRERTLSVKKILTLESKKQRLTLRARIQSHGYPFPNTKKLQAIQSQMLIAAKDRMPCVNWQGVEMRRYRDDLYLMPMLAFHDTGKVITWTITDAPLDIGVGLLKAKVVQGKGLRFDINTISIRFRQGGESVNITGRSRHSLKNLFQAWGVPPWERSRIPLLFSQDKLIGVVGYFLDAAYSAKEDERGWELNM